MQRLETGKFILWGNISSGIQDHQKNDLQPGTKLWGAAWPGRSATIHRCFKTCLVYKLFCPSITREVNSIYMRQPAITRLTESSPPLPTSPSFSNLLASQMRKLDPDKDPRRLHRAQLPAWVLPPPAEAKRLTLPWQRQLSAEPRLCGALTSVNMSYCLPTWQGRFPVFIHSLVSPNQCQ